MRAPASGNGVKSSVTDFMMDHPDVVLSGAVTLLSALLANEEKKVLEMFASCGKESYDTVLGQLIAIRRLQKDLYVGSKKVYAVLQTKERVEL
jgi:hypothetical protein